ncbi:MAG: serine/threonine-protein kinase [Pirellulaceae bacterium]
MGGPIIMVLFFVLARSPQQPTHHAKKPLAQRSPSPRQQLAQPSDQSPSDSHIEIVARLTQRFCPQCRSPLPADSPEGLCPACLMAGGLASEAAPVSIQGDAVTTPPSGSRPPLNGEIGDLQQHFPQLEILELLGRGGMGSVYKARQKNLDRMVALKVIPPDAAKDPAFAERFAREARALARLNHPSIVTVYDFGQAGQVYYLLMEYVDGVNLRHALQASALQPREALAIVPQICDALQYAHDQGVVHRDIKPENILLDRAGRVKIADFGLAKLLGLGADDFQLTRTQQVMGTPRYMAPEQIEKPASVDHRADIYSLGVVLYEMLTGELPLGRFEPPSHKVAIDVRIDQVVLRALEKSPDRRYQRASEVKSELASATSWPSPAAASPAPLAAAYRPAMPVWQTPVPADKYDSAANEPSSLPPNEVLAVAVGMVAGVLMMTGGLAAGIYGLVNYPGFSQDFWGWAGGGFGCVVGGFGSIAGSYNTYRQMNGAEDLMRSPRVTWFDWVMRVYLVLGIVTLVGGLALIDPVRTEQSGRALITLGAIAIFQAILFLTLRSMICRRESPAAAALDPGREAIRRRVAAPGTGLIVAGLLSLLPLAGFLLIGLPAELTGYRAQLTLADGPVWGWGIAALPALPAAIVMLIGGWKMRSRESHFLATLGSIAAMLPCGPAWLITLPLGIWALVVLRDPAVRDAFES